MAHSPASTPPIRTFHIPTGPSAADPAWVIACREGDVQYSDYSEIKKLIAECERKQIEDVGAAKEYVRILKMFGAKGYHELVALAEMCKAQQKEAV